MGSSGSGSGNPMYLSQGGTPIPGLPIAGQGAPNDDPRALGKFQNFLPDIPAAGQGPAPLARGLTSEMMQYRAPGAGSASSEIDSLRQQLAALQAGSGGGGGGGGGGGTAATASEQFGAARTPNAQGNPTANPYGPIPAGYQWLNGAIAGPGAPAPGQTWRP
jgi:hypothetical protein